VTPAKRRRAGYPGVRARRATAGDPQQVRHDLLAADGRVPGRRGRATRDRLVRCTAELLDKTSYRDLKVIEIARCAGTSPATFYQYFPDVEAAILVLAHEMAEEAEELAGVIIGSSWRGAAGTKTAMALVDGFLELWERNRAVLRVVDLSTAEGDLRFQNLRTRMLNQVTVALSEVIDAFKLSGGHPRDVDPMAQAGVLVAMLAHVASHRYGFEFWGIRGDALRRSMARIVHASVTGKG
jgi:AcrR family transcriptional regulator